MFCYTSALIVDKPIDNVLLVLPYYYYDGEYVGREANAYSFRCEAQNSFLVAETCLLVTPDSRHRTTITMKSRATGKILLAKWFLSFAKSFLIAKQVSDLVYLKRKIEEGRECNCK